MTEDKLLLYYYGELSADERAGVEAAFVADPALAARYESLRVELADWRDAPLTPAPESEKRRWRTSIDRLARESNRKQGSRYKGPRAWMLGIAAAMTTALVAGIFIGTILVEDPVPVIAPGPTLAGAEVAAPSVVPVSFTRGLQLHLKDSQSDLSRIAQDDDANRILLTLQLIEQNRLFERAATQNNAPNLARVLRAFEPILLRLASDDIAPEDMEALRRQLAFELKVVLTKLEAAPSKEAHTT
jgi:hypothetical protein